MEKERITKSGFIEEDAEIEVSLRPKRLSDYIGQDAVRSNLEIFIEAARQRGEPLDHVLFYGPPGLGKTTLAGIIANEMDVSLRITSGPAIDRAGDLAAILTNLEENDVLFIDEIHRLNRSVEEVLDLGHGGLCHRYRHRQRAVGQISETGHPSFYADRGDDPGGKPVGAAAGQIRSHQQI